jgi:transcriptional repressor NrdR
VEDRVVDSRESRDYLSVRRRRECLSCGRRFTTYEKLEQIAFKVIKNDGSRQDFDRTKLLRGLEKACEKRPISPLQLERIVDEAEALLLEREDREISTRELGEFLMQRLSELDQVAYVRFASVYRRFEDVGAFLAELKALMQRNKNRRSPRPRARKRR